MNEVLLKAKKVIGLPVYTHQGKKLQEIEDVIYDPASNMVKALVLNEGGIFSDAKIILFSDVLSIGNDAVLVDNETVIKKIGEVDKEIARISKGNSYLTETKLITEDGQDLGKVSDLLFNPEDGRVEQLEVSEGAFNNMKSGKKYIDVADIIKIGKDATIVSAGVVGVFERQGESQGVKGVLNQDIVKSVKDKADRFTDNLVKAGEKLETKASQAANSEETNKVVDAAKMSVIEAKESLEPKLDKLNRKITQKANKYRQRQAGKGEEEMKYQAPRPQGGNRVAGSLGGEAQDIERDDIDEVSDWKK